MPATPKKGRRFGGSSSHQKAMMANLVSSLIAAEGIVTTEAKAKALRPVAEPAGKNPTMYPIAKSGPFYAALLSGGNLDTKGGPKTSPEGQVLDDEDQPIPGLYGVGNCVASASARAYWAGGGTLGPILAYAYLAARRAHLEPIKAAVGKIAAE